MKLLLARHGETEGNVAKITQGQADTPLTQLGEEQGRRLCRRVLEQYDVAKIICSDLGRCKQTIAYLQDKRPDIPVVFDERVRERSYGKFNGTDRMEFVDWRIKQGGDRFIRPPGGESFEDVMERAAKALERWEEEEGTLFVQSHNQFTTATLLEILGAQLDLAMYYMYHPGNTALSEFDLRCGVYYPIMINDMSHLEGLD